MGDGYIKRYRSNSFWAPPMDECVEGDYVLYADRKEEIDKGDGLIELNDATLLIDNVIGVLEKMNTEKILEIAKLNDAHHLNHPAADKFCIQFANAILDAEQTGLKKLCSHAGLLKAQESHNRYVDLVNELIEAATPFLSSDIVDETCGTIPLMNRLELAINNLKQNIGE